MYTETYMSIGLHIDSIEKLTTKYKVSWLIDTDNDSNTKYRCFYYKYKDTEFGHKLALMGSDGKKENKKLLISYAVSLVKKNGWYVEASHKVADILKSNGVDIIKDFEIITKVLGKEVIQLDETNKTGVYKRKIGALGVLKKQLFGNPKL